MKHERVRYLVEYVPDTGQFHWRVARGNRTAGAPAGRLHRDGYIEIRIDGKLYLAHRLAFFYVNGQWPADEIDHVNNDKSDNRWENLRPATRTQNLHNTSGRGLSKYKGVGFHKSAGKWRAYITVDGRMKHLGHFLNEEDAARAYDEAAARTFGAFSRLNFAHTK